MKPFSLAGEDHLKQSDGLLNVDQTRGSVVWTLINLMESFEVNQLVD